MCALGARDRLIRKLLRCRASALGLIGTRLLLSQAALGILHGLSLGLTHGDQALHFLRSLQGGLAAHL